MVSWVVLVGTGVVGGLLAGLFGIGGGLVIVPALYFYLQGMGVAPELAMAMAINTSLVSIIPTSLSSMRAHHRLGNVDWKMVWHWAPFTVLGVVLGGGLVATVRSSAFTVGFGLLLLLVAGYKTFYFHQAENVPDERTLPLSVHRVVAAVIGFVSVCAGVGGGATGVPAMRFMGVPIRRAIGTCAALGVFIALPGALAILLLSAGQGRVPAGSFHLVYGPALVLLVPFTVLFAPLGAKLGSHLNPRVLNGAFAMLLVVVGLRMVVSGL